MTNTTLTRLLHTATCASGVSIAVLLALLVCGLHPDPTDTALMYIHAVSIGNRHMIKRSLTKSWADRYDNTSIRHDVGLATAAIEKRGGVKDVKILEYAVREHIAAVTAQVTYADNCSEDITLDLVGSQSAGWGIAYWKAPFKAATALDSSIPGTMRLRRGAKC